MIPVLTPCPLDDGHHILTGAVSLPDQLSTEGFEALWRLRPEEAPRIRMLGRMVALPRRQKAFGRDYAFSGTVSRAEPIPAELAPFLAWAQQQVDPRLNGLLVNWYDGALGEYIGAHQDSERGLVAGAPITTISVGAARTFRMQKEKTRRDFPVTNGSVIVIPWKTNRHWKHAVPHFAKDAGRRISVTLRAFSDEPSANPQGKTKRQKARPIPKPPESADHAVQRAYQSAGQ